MIRIKGGIFSMSPPALPDDDGSYLRWHLLDHMPEQYQLPGLVHAHRWIADGAYLDSRIAGDGPLADVGNVVNYLFGDPVQQTLDDFMELGRRLVEVGRFPQFRPSLQLRMHALLRWYAAPRVLVSPEVVPFRPHRGVLVIVEQPVDDTDEWMRWLHAEHVPALLDTPGTAGAWMYGSTGFWKLPAVMDGDAQYVTIVYLDDDPLTTARSLAPMIEERWASGRGPTPVRRPTQDDDRLGGVDLTTSPRTLPDPTHPASRHNKKAGQHLWISDSARSAWTSVRHRCVASEIEPSRVATTRSGQPKRGGGMRSSRLPTWRRRRRRSASVRRSPRSRRGRRALRR